MSIFSFTDYYINTPLNYNFVPFDSFNNWNSVIDLSISSNQPIFNFTNPSIFNFNNLWTNCSWNNYGTFNFFGNNVKVSNPSSTSGTSSTQKTDSSTVPTGKAGELYKTLGLEKEGLSYEVFALAMEGYQNLKDKGNGYLGIVDPNTKKYYLVDLNQKRFVGKSDTKFGSGRMDTVANANKQGSHATLSGFQKVAEDYKGKWDGRAKRVDGLERGINDNARSKATVIHSTTKNSTWGCIGITPVYKNGRVDEAATTEKINRLFPKGTILFTYPTNVGEYKKLSALV